MLANKIFIDGVIFQIQHNRPGGISRVWRMLLGELAKSPLAQNIILLDRKGTAPSIPGIKTLTIWAYNQVNFEADSLSLEEFIKSEGADLFISTYYTYPENAPCMIMLHDMTPEVMALDLNHPEWRAKAKAIEKSFAYFSVSRSTEQFFRKIYPHFTGRPVYLVPNAVSDDFQIHHEEDVQWFKRSYEIENPYFLFVGHRMGYKNAMLFFRGFSLLENKDEYEILCTGGAAKLEKSFLPYINGSRCQIQYLTDRELSIAYQGALALIYPSLHEGFGLPLLEAMRAGCPVIACHNSSIPEVAGDAAIYVESYDVQGMREALCQVQDHGIRENLVKRGFENAGRFSWINTGTRLVEALTKTVAEIHSVKPNESDPVETGMRLVVSLLKESKYKSLCQAMINTIQYISIRNDVLDFQNIETHEKTITSETDDHVFQLLETEVNQNGTDGFIHYWYGLNLQQKGEKEKAFKMLSTALEVGLRSSRIGYLAADLAYQLKKVPTAINLYSQLFKVSSRP